MTGFAKGTVTKLLVDMGEVCREYHDEHVCRLRCKRIQTNEIWAFVGCKEEARKAGASGHNDVWTWTAMDPDTNLMVSYEVGPRDGSTAYHFMHDLAGRVLNQIQLTTDGLAAYIDAVGDVFGPYCDHSQLVKLFSDDPRFPANAERKSSPSRICGCEEKTRQGDPDPNHVCTSHVERQNLAMRMSMRRFPRLTDAFSKKVANHEAAIALHFMHYNFCRVHQSLRVTPAMEAGLTDHVWAIEELAALLAAKEAEVIGTEANKRGPYKKRNDSN